MKMWRRNKMKQMVAFVVVMYPMQSQNCLKVYKFMDRKEKTSIAIENKELSEYSCETNNPFRYKSIEITELSIHQSDWCGGVVLCYVSPHYLVAMATIRLSFLFHYILCTTNRSHAHNELRNLSRTSRVLHEFFLFRFLSIQLKIAYNRCHS